MVCVDESFACEDVYTEVSFGNLRSISFRISLSSSIVSGNLGLASELRRLALGAR